MHIFWHICAHCDAHIVDMMIVIVKFITVVIIIIKTNEKYHRGQVSFVTLKPTILIGWDTN
jgi:hypothetical protein